MSEKLLSIAIPTYNRADTLSLLLNTLSLELSGLENLVDVIIGDNSSTDRTLEVTATFEAIWPSTTVLRHDHNLGPDENFCQCIDRVNTRYFWIIGDDDLPKSGVIRNVVSLLKRELPDLVYLHSEWSKDITSASQGIPVDQLNYKTMSQLDFASHVNVWFTFISGLVVNREAFMRSHDVTEIRRYSGTNLVQLGWVLGVLKAGRRFIYVADPCILARAGNTGGYAVVTVFGENLIRIVIEIFGAKSQVTRVIIRRNIIGYLPQLIWNVRFGRIGDFSFGNAWNSLKCILSGYVYFWLILTPISLAPKPIAWSFFQISRIIRKLACFFK